MKHVGIVVDDLAAATEFFVELGLELQGEGVLPGRRGARTIAVRSARISVAGARTHALPR
jgi:catechol 2,3-dioxygenase-like lactoylglutathione lyase family enzyme